MLSVLTTGHREDYPSPPTTLNPAPQPQARIISLTAGDGHRSPSAIGMVVCISYTGSLVELTDPISDGLDAHSARSLLRTDLEEKPVFVVSATRRAQDE